LRGDKWGVETYKVFILLIVLVFVGDILGSLLFGGLGSIALVVLDRRLDRANIGRVLGCNLGHVYVNGKMGGKEVLWGEMDVRYTEASMRRRGG
jgi:hypothetical protein